MNLAAKWLGLGLLTSASVAGAQCCSQLSGVVTDVSGAVVPGAAITASCAGNVVKGATTSAQGSYTISDPAKECVVTATAAGFQPERRENIEIGLNSRLDFRLAPALAVHTVTPAETPARVGTAAAASVPAAKWEYGALVQSGFGVTEDRSSFKFLMAGAHLGRILTPNVGPGALRGNFEYAVELFPFWQSYTPKFQRANCVLDPLPTPPPGGTYASCSGPYTTGGTYTGASITPIILRWNLTSGRKFMPWIQGAGGLVWTDHKYPGFGMPTPTGAGGVFGPPSGATLLAQDGPGTDTSVWNFTPQFGVGAHYFVRPNRSIDFGANAVHISSASLGDKNPGVNASVQLNVGYTWWK